MSATTTPPGPPQPPAGPGVRIEPGAVRIAGQVIEYAIGRSIGGATAVHIVGVFPARDARAVLLLASPPGLDHASLQLAVAAAVYRCVVAAGTGRAEADVPIPAPIGCWPLGTTQADIDAERAAQVELPDHPGVISLDRYRRDRAGRGDR